MNFLKKSFAIALVSFVGLSGAASAQMHTLIDGEVRHGGWGGPTVAATWIDGEPAVMVGGFGAWVINGSFAIGGGGAGIATLHRVEGYEPGRHTLEGGYGGVTLEYTHRPHDLIHMNVGTLIGAGGMAIYEGSRTKPSRASVDDTAFFVARPQLGAALNVTRFLQVNLMGAYRLVSGSTLEGYGDAALSGPEFALGLRFGSF